MVADCASQATALLDQSGYLLVKALQSSQPSFCVTDPQLPDNPIVYASDTFIELTGYDRCQVLGRNCRFLQGPDTDPDAVAKIRKGIEEVGHIVEERGAGLFVSPRRFRFLFGRVCSIIVVRTAQFVSRGSRMALLPGSMGAHPRKAGGCDSSQEGPCKSTYGVNNKTYLRIHGLEAVFSSTAVLLPLFEID